MSPALMALVHTSLLQQQANRTDDPECKTECLAAASPLDLEKGTSSAVATIARRATAAEAQSFAAQLPALLKELVEIASEIARTDGLLKEAEQGAPQEAEARKWHEVMLRALRWSRDALADRQSTTLAQMKELVQEGRARAGVAPAEPTPTPAPKPSCANVDVPRFRPALKQHVEQDGAPKVTVRNAELVGSLAKDLETLRRYDRECCIHVRKIKRLGMQSPEKLREHFSSYGELAEVLVSHTFQKPTAGRANGRVRAAAMGFLVLRSPEAAKAILAAGNEHVLCSGPEAVTVTVERYEPTHAEVGLER